MLNALSDIHDDQRNIERILFDIKSEQEKQQQQHQQAYQQLNEMQQQQNEMIDHHFATQMATQALATQQLLQLMREMLAK